MATNFALVKFISLFSLCHCAGLDSEEAGKLVCAAAQWFKSKSNLLTLKNWFLVPQQMILFQFLRWNNTRKIHPNRKLLHRNTTSCPLELNWFYSFFLLSLLIIIIFVCFFMLIAIDSFLFFHFVSAQQHTKVAEFNVNNWTGNRNTYSIGILYQSK